MKLLITIVQDPDVQPLLEKLTENGLSATKLASTGGFLKAGNTTLLIGVTDDKVALTLDIIEDVCKSNPDKNNRRGLLSRSPATSVGSATVFKLDVERFERI
ncbi:MAG: hypothetical protein GX208_04920 [Firmicutes bacterium]|nr:hypothetical protein [Bacillota bacterium]